MDEFKRDHDQQSSAGMSRTEYRRQLLHHQDHETTGQTVNRPTSADEEPHSAHQSREDTAEESKMVVSNEKMARLKRRLNIAIAALVAAIVIVYLILFLVKWEESWYEIWNYLCNARRN